MKRHAALLQHSREHHHALKLKLWKGDSISYRKLSAVL